MSRRKAAKPPPPKAATRGAQPKRAQARRHGRTTGADGLEGLAESKATKDVFSLSWIAAHKRGKAARPRSKLAKKIFSCRRAQARKRDVRDGLDWAAGVR